MIQIINAGAEALKSYDSRGCLPHEAVFSGATRRGDTAMSIKASQHALEDI